MSRVAALGQSIGMMLPGDEVIKVIITAYVFAQFEVALLYRLIDGGETGGRPPCHPRPGGDAGGGARHG